MAHRLILLVFTCGVILLSNVAEVHGFTRAFVALKNMVSSRTHSVLGPSCFTLRSLRTVGSNEGTYNNSMVQSFKSCRNLCKKKGHEQTDIIAIEVDLCHCGKEFRKNGRADVNKCLHSCPGRIEERCGGPGHISAYPYDMKIDY
ncbi:hypothetical protein BOX15_Mlig022985g1 [Macrostomum lignano]|uniref:WSC domain-containing protein n=1 Tax=Macrostomum lignano TaxID=282301 RepID=A0A267FE53_9PLAT|nr:hypothetical protein BOX15_Mlig022985g2 [Macrostomum lignano]PAA72088.1 hypothetical protein BOX15_Mlig022985g1 [Macrostomum lignano]